MQIYHLWVDDHKCLKNFDIPFRTTDSASTTILIGENGSGKSTMIETILEILMSFDSPAMEKNISYDYNLDYEYAQKNISIVRRGNCYYIAVDGECFEGSYAGAREWLDNYRVFPKRIIAFYSGANNKLAPEIRKMNTSFKKNYLSAMDAFFTSMNSPFPTEPIVTPVRKYNFCDEHLVPVYLCALLGGSSSYEKDYLFNECRFSHIARLNMIIDLDKVERFFGNERFEGEYAHHLFHVLEYIDHELNDYLRRGFLYTSRGKGYFEIEEFRDCGVDAVAILEFFEILHDLFGAKFETYISIDNEVVASTDLSEGQRQLIKVLGMLGICKNEDCLILLDEPDAHMNPQWKYGIKKIMDGCLSKAQNAQAIIATHDPLVINGVNKDFIRIFDKAEGRTVVRIPTVDTAGMGIDGLLQSQYYGLESTLDIETQELLEEKRNLLVKRKSDRLSHDEQLRLRYLSETLENMAFARNVPTDNYYDDFAAAVYEIYRNRPMISLSPEQIEERNSTLREIAKGLIDV